MADLVKDSRASMDTSSGMFAPQKCGDLYAGEALGVAAPCYIAADGKVYQSNGTAATIAAHFDGMTPRACAIGQAVTLVGVGARFRYGTALTPGTDLFVSATAGNLSDTATTGGVRAIARVISATDIVVTKNSDQA